MDNLDHVPCRSLVYQVRNRLVCRAPVSDHDDTLIMEVKLLVPTRVMEKTALEFLHAVDVLYTNYKIIKTYGRDRNRAYRR